MVPTSLVLANAESALMVDFINLNRDGVPGQIILAISLITYLAILFVISLLASRRVHTEADFLVAGRRLGLFLCWGSLIATWFGASTMIGSASAARAEGMRGTVLEPWACSFTLVIAGIFYAPKLWRMKLLTSGDFYRRVYGPKAELILSCVQIPGDFGWIAGQFLSLAAIQHAYFGIHENWGILIAFAITLIYTMIGGMWSVTVTDTVQIVIAFAGLMVLAAASFAAFGAIDSVSATTLDQIKSGASRVWNETPADDLTLRPPLDATASFLFVYLGAWATGLFGNLPGQDLQQRMFSAKSSQTARWACVLAGVFYLLFGLIPVALGLMSRLELPVDQTVVDVNILIYLAGKNMGVYLAVIFVVTFVSILTATACSAILAPANLLGHNILGRIPSLRAKKLATERFSVLVISLGAVLVAYSGESILDLLDLTLSIALVALFIPLTMGLYGRPRGELSAILAAVCGLTLFAARTIPEKFFLPVPASLGARATVQVHFNQLKQSMTPDDKNSTDRIRANISEAQQLARTDMQRTLSEIVGSDSAGELTNRYFESGFDWSTYMDLRFREWKFSPAFRSILSTLVAISADFYGLGASLAGYFVGQLVLKRRGGQWQPGLLDPPATEL